MTLLLRQGKYYTCDKCDHLIYVHRISNNQRKLRPGETIMISLLTYTETPIGVLFADEYAVQTWFGNDSDTVFPWTALEEVRVTLR